MDIHMNTEIMFKLISAGIVAFIFFGIGTLFRLGKGAFLIAGYNRLPKAERERYDKAALCKFIGKMMFLMGLGVLLCMVGESLSLMWLFGVGGAIFIGSVLFTLYYCHTFKRFKLK